MKASKLSSHGNKPINSALSGSHGNKPVSSALSGSASVPTFTPLAPMSTSCLPLMMEYNL